MADINYDRWQTVVGALGVGATVVFGVVAYGQNAGWFGAHQVAEPQAAPAPIVSQTGIVIEAQSQTAKQDAPPGDAEPTLVVRVAPDSGKWRQLLCKDDEILAIDGHSVSLRDAQQTLYNDGGSAVRVRKPGNTQIETIDSGGFERC